MTQQQSPIRRPGLITRYREVITTSGFSYVLIAALARLPLAMSQLGTLLLVSGVTGSYAAGGISAGALAVANAIGSPTAGWLTDRLGQRWVVLISSLVAGSALFALVFAAEAEVAWPALAVLAGTAGVFLPQIGSLARVRWPLMINRADADPQSRRRRLETAFSYEGTADEASFMIGPALVGLGAAMLSPSGALLFAAGMIMVFGSLFALHPSAVLTGPNLRVSESAKGRLLSPQLLVLIAGLIFMGVIFGSVQTASTVLATAAGQPGLTGGLHALLGLGSVVAGVCLPLLPERLSLPTRYCGFAVAMAVLAMPLLWVQTISQLPLLLIGIGLTVAPYMITSFTMAERIADPRRLGTVMTVLAATIGVGYAAGSSLAGRLADLNGHQGAYWVTVTAAIAAALLAVLTQRVIGRRSESVDPPPVGESPVPGPHWSPSTGARVAGTVRGRHPLSADAF